MAAKKTTQAKALAGAGPAAKNTNGDDGTGWDSLDAFGKMDIIDAEIERADMPVSRKMARNDAIERMRRIAKADAAADALEGRLPEPGTTWHIISAAKYDYWQVIAEAVRIAGGADEFYGSTWTLSRNNVLELLELYDTGRIKKFAILTGTYFKARETAVYAQLLTGIANRGQRYVAFINHTKIALIRRRRTYIVLEGSANFTANPRLENYIIANSKELYEFHQEWMEEMLTRKK